MLWKFMVLYEIYIKNNLVRILIARYCRSRSLLAIFLPMDQRPILQGRSRSLFAISFPVDKRPIFQGRLRSLFSISLPVDQRLILQGRSRLLFAITGQGLSLTCRLIWVTQTGSGNLPLDQRLLLQGRSRSLFAISLPVDQWSKVGQGYCLQSQPKVTHLLTYRLMWLIQTGYGTLPLDRRQILQGRSRP